MKRVSVPLSILVIAATVLACGGEALSSTPEVAGAPDVGPLIVHHH